MKIKTIIFVIALLLANIGSVVAICPVNCLTCTGVTCTACATTFYINSGNCLRCADVNCATCDSSGSTCTSCISGYMPRISDSLCIQCAASTDSNCCSGSSCAVCQAFARNSMGFCDSCRNIYRSC